MDLEISEFSMQVPASPSSRMRSASSLHPLCWPNTNIALFYCAVCFASPSSPRARAVPEQEWINSSLELIPLMSLTRKKKKKRVSKLSVRMKSVHINLPGNRGTQQLSRLQDLLQLRHISAKTLRSGYSCSQRENVKYLLYNMRRCSSSRLTFCLQTLEGFCLHTTPLVPCCCLTISLLLFGKTQATRFFSIFLL